MSPVAPKSEAMKALEKVTRSETKKTQMLEAINC